MGMLQRSQARKALTKPEVVVITGASAGVGRATAQAFAKRGASIGLVARGDEGLQGAQSDYSVQLWADTHRGWLTLAGVGLAGLAYAALCRNGRRAPPPRQASVRGMDEKDR